MIDFGLTAGEFRERYAEREPYFRRLALRGAPFEWAELDAALQRVEPTAPIVQLFNGGPLAEERYTDVVVELGAPRRRLAKRRFYGELKAGATLVVNGFEHYSPTALRLCAEVGRFRSAAAVGNAYLSIGGRGTFGRHWDTHDVFALQLLGRKRWQVFAPTFPLPLGVHRSEAERPTVRQRRCSTACSRRATCSTCRAAGGTTCCRKKARACICRSAPTPRPCTTT